MNPKSPSSKKTERKLRFPDNLIELEITAGDVGESIKTLDLSRLSCLEKLKVNSLGEEEEEYLHCYLKLPSSLKELRCESGHFMAETLDKMCPQLTKLKIKEVPLEQNQLVAMMKNLPPALEYLEVPQKAFPNALSTATVRKVKGKPQKVPAKIALPPQQNVALPSTLKEFKLGRLDLDKSDPAKFDFDASDLPNLDTLRVSGNRSLRLAGKFPSNLTTMRLSYVSKLDLTHLDSLQSLTRLEITGGIGTHEFTFKLPESLKFLEVSTAELRKIHVNAPNLQELTSYGNEYGVLNESNFVIPMNLKKLSLGMCDIEQINVSLPSTLTELHLESNALQSVSDLPVGLKHLNLASNPLGDVADGLPSVFPLELETLDLSDSGVNEKWIRKSNLGSLTNFKSIDLSFNKFNQLDPSCFPESLVVLDMHKAGVWKLKTDFKSLVNLQQLDLSDNMVGPYSDSFKKKGGIFGDAIRFVSIRDTGIWESTAKALYEELLQKPDFEFLDIPEDMVPKFKTPSGLKIKKIGCLCEGYAKGGLFDFL